MKDGMGGMESLHMESLHDERTIYWYLYMTETGHGDVKSGVAGISHFRRLLIWYRGNMFRTRYNKSEKVGILLQDVDDNGSTHFLLFRKNVIQY